MRRIVCALAMLAAGCALLQPEGDGSRQAREIIGEAVAAARAAPEEQRQRLAQARQRYDAVPSEPNGLRYAALLVTLPPPWRDDDRAAAVLGPLAAQRSDSALTQLAALLAAGVAERQRLAQELRGAERRTESAVQRADAATQRAESAERREESAVERANTLQKQVEALKSIERSILQREEQRRNIKR